MSELLKLILALSLSGTLLFFILLALKPLYKSKLCKRWQYYIWLIVVARMLLSFTPETTLVGSVFEHLDSISVGTGRIAPSTNDTRLDVALGDDYIVPRAWQLAPQSNIDSAPTRSAQTIFSKVYENLWVLWIAVAFGIANQKNYDVSKLCTLRKSRTDRGIRH